MLQLRKTQLQTLSVSRQILQIYPMHKIQFFMIQYGGIYKFLSDVFITVAIMKPTNKKPLSLTISTILVFHNPLLIYICSAHQLAAKILSTPFAIFLLCCHSIKLSWIQTFQVHKQGKFGLKSAVYKQERFQIKSGLWWHTYGFYFLICFL